MIVLGIRTLAEWPSYFHILMADIGAIDCYLSIYLQVKKSYCWIMPFYVLLCLFNAPLYCYKEMLTRLENMLEFYCKHSRFFFSGTIARNLNKIWLDEFFRWNLFNSAKIYVTESIISWGKQKKAKKLSVDSFGKLFIYYFPFITFLCKKIHGKSTWNSELCNSLYVICIFSDLSELQIGWAWDFAGFLCQRLAELWRNFFYILNARSTIIVH